jgi:protein phosphatase PTC7
MILRGEEDASQSTKTKELVIRFASREQQHSFNFPFQCGTNGDDPMKAESLAHPVNHGDIIVLGSDGLWDNLHRATIVEMIRPYVKWTEENSFGMIEDVGLISEMLAKEAEKLSYRHNYLSPFAESARAYGYECNGGKPDDITVIVAQV